MGSPSSSPRQQRFALLPEHVTLLRAAHVEWNGAEWGAPTIDPKKPYGNGAIAQDLYRLLTGDHEWDDRYGLPRGMSPADWEKWWPTGRALHAATETALQVVLASGSFEPGLYVADEYRRNWRRDG